VKNATLIGAIMAIAAPAHAQGILSQRLPCPGDCNDDGIITINEMVRSVAIVMNRVPTETCDAFGADHAGVDTLVRSVRYSLRGCPPSGWCVIDDATPMTQDLCCNESIVSAQPLPVHWCAALDSASGTCAVPSVPPCAGCTVNGAAFAPDIDCAEDDGPPVVYRLGEGSQYYFLFGSRPPQVSALRGTIQLVRRHGAEGFEQYRIVDIAFAVGEGSISGHDGSVLIADDLAPPVSMQAIVDIGGEPLELAGTGGPDTFSGTPPRFRGLRIEGRRGARAVGRVFRFTIYADPEP
jgi:hypothetical protein